MVEREKKSGGCCGGKDKQQNQPPSANPRNSLKITNSGRGEGRQKNGRSVAV